MKRLIVIFIVMFQFVALAQIDTTSKSKCQLSDREKFEILMHKKNHKGHYIQRQWDDKKGCIIKDIYLIDGKEADKKHWDKQ